MDQIPNTNSTIQYQLFEYRIIRIIHCNSGIKYVQYGVNLVLRAFNMAILKNTENYHENVLEIGSKWKIREEK